MAINTKRNRWVRRGTNEPVTYIRITTMIDSATLVRYAAESFQISEDGDRLVDYTTGKRISRKALENAIVQDMQCNGMERMDWDYTDEQIEVAKQEVTRLFPEWTEWIAKFTG